jgi:hypothetical protein
VSTTFTQSRDAVEGFQPDYDFYATGGFISTNL